MEETMIRLEIQGATPREIEAQLLAFARIFGQEGQAVLPLTVAEKPPGILAPEAINYLEEAKAEAAEAPKKEKKEKKASKPKTVAEVVVEEVETLGEETEAPSERVVTKQEIADTFQKLSGKKGLDAARAILSRFVSASGEACRRISELQEADYLAVVEACEEEMA
jgi:ribosomal protein S25